MGTQWTAFIGSLAIMCIIHSYMCPWDLVHFLIYQSDGLVHDCSNSIAKALELLQSCTKPLKWSKVTTLHYDTSLLAASISGAPFTNKDMNEINHLYYSNP